MDVLNPASGTAHLTVFQHCVEPDDEPVLVAPWIQGHLLLTRRRLVVTRRSGMLRRMRLHLNATLGHLSNVSWTVDGRNRIEVSLTAVDGVRERFVLRLGSHEEVRQVEERLRSVMSLRRGDFAPAA